MAQCVSIALSSQLVPSSEQPSPAVVQLSSSCSWHSGLFRTICLPSLLTLIVLSRSVSSLLATRSMYCTTTFDSNSLPAGGSGVRTPVGGGIFMCYYDVSRRFVAELRKWSEKDVEVTQCGVLSWHNVLSWHTRNMKCFTMYISSLHI